jgi:hypothetical protein
MMKRITSILGVAALLVGLTAAQTETASLDPLRRRIQPRRGDICFVCNKPLAAADIVYQVDGQRLAVHKEKCDAILRSDPQAWTAKLKAHGAFLSAVPDLAALSPAWFLLGLYVLAGLMFAGVCAHRAFRTGQRPAPWFFAGLTLNAGAYLWLLLRSRGAQAANVPPGLRKIAATAQPAPCLACGAMNHPSARVCLSCGAALQPLIPAEVTRC